MRYNGPIRSTNPVRALLLASFLLSLSGAPASAGRFDITPGDPNLIRFESKAPMESFDGKTRQVSGHILCDPSALEDSIEVLIEVDLATLDTGIKLRNQHMRENHLETERYPKAVFRGAKLEERTIAALQPGQPARLNVRGTFELHGEAHEIVVPLEVTLSADPGPRTLRITGGFPVKLSDYKINRPQFLVMRVDETQRVTLELRATETSQQTVRD